MRHPIHIGTSGWSYDDWLGPFYEPGTAKGDYLAAYAREFDAVEVDSTFYRTPGRRMVEGWAAKTPAGFRFALKVPRVITHDQVLLDCDEAMDKLLAALEPLGEKCLCLLLQFKYFNRKAFSSAGAFLERLDAFLARYATRVPLACEIRNKNWVGAPYFDLLRSHNVSAALVEHVWMPRIDWLLDEYDVVTGPLSYVRLLGDRQGIEEQTQSWDKVVVDRVHDLDRVAESLHAIAARAELLVFVNNHYAGHAPQTCRDLAERVGA